jgi:hypothetical protein
MTVLTPYFRGIASQRRSFFSKSASFVFALTLTTGLWTQTVVDAKTLALENEFLKIIVNDQVLDKGRFSIETTQGNPENPMDDKQPLIFGRPIPWTSYTTIFVDGTPVIFGGENKKIQKRSGQTYRFSQAPQQQRSDNGIQTTATVETHIQVEQSLRFFRNPSTKVLDTVLITYTMTNTDSAPHQVGLRLMMDTKLGNNDGAPLRMGYLTAASEKEIAEKDLFPFWQAFDDLPSPNIVAQGTLELREADIFPPDRVILANWGSLVDSPWDYSTQEGQSFIRAGETEKDTALALYWDPIKIPAQGKRTVRTLYGLGGLSLSSGALSLGLTAPAEYAVASGRELLIVGYISNVSGFDSQDTQVTFTLPPGFRPIGGKRTFELGTLKRDETRQIPLRLLPEDTVEPGTQSIAFTVTSATLETNHIQRKIEIMAPLKVRATLALSDAPVSATQTEIQATLTLKNPHDIPVQNIVATLKNIGKLTLPDYELATKNIPVIAPKSSVTLNWRLRESTKDVRIPTVSVQVITPGHPPETLQKSLRTSLSKPQWRIQTSHGQIQTSDAFYLWLAGDTLNGKNPEYVDISFDPAILQVLHYSPPEWAASASITQTVGQVRILLPEGPSPLASLPLGLLHFRAIGAQTSTVHIQSPAYSDTQILIPIHHEVPQ